MADWEAVRASLVRHKQEHLLKFLPELNETQQAQLYADVCEVDFPRLDRYFAMALENLSNCEEKKDELLQPLDSSICGSTARDIAEATQWERIGRALHSNHDYTFVIIHVHRNAACW